MSSRTRILEQIESIPTGMLSTYGQIALLCGSTPRYVARVLAGHDEEALIPWHRVINSMGKISSHPNAGGSGEQRIRLAAEGHQFSPSGQILDWKNKLWAKNPAVDNP